VLKSLQWRLSLFLYPILGGAIGFGCNATPTVTASQSTQETQNEVGVERKVITGEHEMINEAVFAGGCFWCVEGVFRQLSGVNEVISGYTGGTAETANYRDVSSGRTRHAEAVRIIFDPEAISFEQLLDVFFATHDPTQLNRQGPDVGAQYRSAIFYANEAQKLAATDIIRQLESEQVFTQPIVTTLEPLETFYVAEEYHQDYVTCNPNQPYIVQQALPKIQKVREKFRDLVISE